MKIEAWNLAPAVYESQNVLFQIAVAESPNGTMFVERVSVSGAPCWCR